MIDRDASLSGLLTYNANVFERTTIESMQNNFVKVLKQVTDNPDLPLTELPLFQPEKQQHLAERRQQPAYQAPRTPTEIAITQLWETVFGRQNIGVQDDFLALGGHSLLAMRLITALNEQFGLAIPLANMQTCLLYTSPSPRDRG